MHYRSRRKLILKAQLTISYRPCAVNNTYLPTLLELTLQASIALAKFQGLLS